MTAQGARFAQVLPDAYFLDLPDVDGLSRYLHARSWIQPEEELREVEPAGEGNMNCTLRVTTTRRSFVLKQSRPWVEKYPQIEAPVERARIEAAFYAAVADQPEVAALMPALEGWDDASVMLMLEDLGPAADYTAIYGGAAVAVSELDRLVDYLVALHGMTVPDGGAARFANRAMRSLNHEHIFRLPLADNSLDLDGITSGLQEVADTLRQDAAYVTAVTELGVRYLADGPVLLHGDYFPGSWVRARGAVRVIDPEFCFLGPSAYDLGVMSAHLLLAGQPREVVRRLLDRYTAGATLDLVLTGRFAGVEMMRRLIGVAQLPLEASIEAEAGVAGVVATDGLRTRSLGGSVRQVVVTLMIAGLFGFAASVPEPARETEGGVATPAVVDPIPVWIDTDPSNRPGGYEVDDGFALIQAFNSPELAIRGVSLVFGNAPLDIEIPIGREIVESFGPDDLGLYIGAAGEDELGEMTEASEALTEALRREPLRILVLGPGTNIGTVLIQHPKLAERMVELIAVAGRRPGAELHQQRRHGAAFVRLQLRQGCRVVPGHPRRRCAVDIGAVGDLVQGLDARRGARPARSRDTRHEVVGTSFPGLGRTVADPVRRGGLQSVRHAGGRLSDLAGADGLRASACRDSRGARRSGARRRRPGRAWHRDRCPGQVVSRRGRRARCAASRELLSHLGARLRR